MLFRGACVMALMAALGACSALRDSPARRPATSPEEGAARADDGRATAEVWACVDTDGEVVVCPPQVELPDPGRNALPPGPMRQGREVLQEQLDALGLVPVDPSLPPVERLMPVSAAVLSFVARLGDRPYGFHFPNAPACTVRAIGDILVGLAAALDGLCIAEGDAQQCEVLARLSAELAERAAAFLEDQERRGVPAEACEDPLRVSLPLLVPPR